jgi:copper(I)-binding protein
MGTMNARYALQLACAALAFAATGACATAVVTVSQPWVRPAAAHAMTRAFLVLGSSTDATLVAARSPIAQVVLMRGAAPMDGIAVAAGKPVPMSDAGPHLALRGVARALKLGDRVPLTLTLRHADGRVQDIDVSAEVRRHSPIDDERRAHAKH